MKVSVFFIFYCLDEEISDVLKLLFFSNLKERKKSSLNVLVRRNQL